MARKQTVAKTFTINRTAPSSSSGLERYRSGLGRLAEFADGVGEDLPPGEKLVGCFRQPVGFGRSRTPGSIPLEGWQHHQRRKGIRRAPNDQDAVRTAHPQRYFWCSIRDFTRKYFLCNHGVRQGGLVRDQEVGGSNPLAPTITPFIRLYAQKGGNPDPKNS